MAEQISLTDLVNLQNETTAVNAINSNNVVITEAFLDVLSRSGVQPNPMESTLDMNSNHIINLPPPTTGGEPFRLIDAQTLIDGGTIVVEPLPTGGTAGQVLEKNSSTNYDVSWQTAQTLPTGGTVGQVLEKNSSTNFDASWQTIPQGTMAAYDTRVIAVAATIPSSINYIRTAGYYLVNDHGGAYYRRTTGTSIGGFQTADGSWWQLTEMLNRYTPQMFGAKGDGSTDDTTALQSAINATPEGGMLYIPPSYFYSPTGQYIGGYVISSTLNVSNAINISGGGMYSNIKPTPSFPTASPNITLTESTYYFGITWESFAIGNDSTAVPYTRYGGIGIDISAVSIPGMRFENIILGESSNAYTFQIDGAGTQSTSITKCRICGGLLMSAIADSSVVQDNVFQGRSTFGVVINPPGAGGLQFTGNSCTAVGGVMIQGGSGSVIMNNYFEELLGFPTNNSSFFGTNSLLGISAQGSAMQGTVVSQNLFNMGQSTNGIPLYVASAAPNTTVVANVFNNSSNGNTGSILNLSTSLIGGPNTYNQSVHVVGGGSYFLNYGLN